MSKIDSEVKPPSVWSILHPVVGKIRFAMVLSAFASAFTVLGLIALAWALQSLFSQSDQFPWVAMGIATLSVALSYVFKLFSFNQSHYAAFRLETLLRRKLAAHLAKVPLGYVEDTGPAALAKIMMDDVKALHAFVADSTPLYARSYVSPLVSFVVLFILDWRLGLVATAVLVFGFGVIAKTMSNSHEMMHRFNLAREQVSISVVEYVQAMPVVRSFDSGTATFGRYQKALENYLEIVLQWYQKAGFSARFSMAILNPMPTVTVVLWFGVWLFLNDGLSLAALVAVLLICTGMAEALLPLMSLKHLISRTQMSVQRIQQVLETPVLKEVEIKDAQLPSNSGIEFKNVGFRYKADQPNVLHDISFIAKPDTITALVGPSGAGKTTVARLVARFWDTSEGQILIGGADLRLIPTESLMQQVALVFQDTFLFSGTIAENITIGMPDASLDDVIEAAKAAQAHEFIMSFPAGYQTLCGERGIFLSGGQRQRITIARAILQNRPILVLDEATAFADAENEAAIVKALAYLMKGKTVLMVAHRLSTIRHADQILVFDRGRLEECGKHDELVAKSGVYARLWSHYERARDWRLTGETM
ncbi:ABC transporter ATP-binding protein [Brucella pseudogrignonensis]|uniref:ATP-binding cassette subfamily B protein n=1 Tax=Brucella pseudogrignonensis TaxID=419475 RepID=A0ABU1MB13_9HYPH|nr:ABC transporter ATP-binding protein [Brucella pseudogrignonensis]MDR6433230.1 ATP-binding cassette subfamily B protein [Brucella pseudogrignonensis]